MTRISVRTTSRKYDVVVERRLLRAATTLLQEFVPQHTKVFLVTSETVLKHCSIEISASFAEAELAFAVLSMADGESAKRLHSVEKLASRMVAAGADRHSVVLALGGGVVGDVAGFLASIFMRGIPVVQIPTTLVAQVDSSIGGKTGVNLIAGKNLIGTFHQPFGVLVDPTVLLTLPDREYRSGLFEAMKYGVIRNPAIFDLMESNRTELLKRDLDLLEHLIVECVRVKADVVSSDEREGGERRILNFGHTIGHCLESATKYRQFLHGEAVGWGMVAAAAIGQAMGVTDKTTAERITALVRAYGPLPKVDLAGRRILRLLQSDKKTVGGVPHFILASKIGHVEIVNNVSSHAILGAVAEIARLSQI